MMLNLNLLHIRRVWRSYSTEGADQTPPEDHNKEAQKRNNIGATESKQRIKPYRFPTPQDLRLFTLDGWYWKSYRFRDIYSRTYAKLVPEPFRVNGTILERWRGFWIPFQETQFFQHFRWRYPLGKLPTPFFLGIFPAAAITHYCHTKSIRRGYGSSNMRQLVEQQVPAASETVYRPTPWVGGPCTMFIASNIWKKQYWNWYTREYISEGLALDWLSVDPANAPVVLLLPGLTGDSRSPYITQLARQSRRAGCRVCVIKRHDLPTVPHRTADLSSAVDHVRSRFPEAPLFLGAFSHGCLTAIHYMSEKERRCPLTGCFLGSPVLDHQGTSMSLRGDSRFRIVPLWDRLFLDAAFTRHLSKFLRKNRAEITDKIGIENYKSARRTLKLYVYDRHVLAPLNGTDVGIMYRDMEVSPQTLSRIHIPTLLLLSERDRFSPTESWPNRWRLWGAGHHIGMVTTWSGSHLAFLEGWWPRRRSYMNRLFGDFRDAVLTQRYRYFPTDWRPESGETQSQGVTGRLDSGLQTLGNLQTVTQ